MIPSIKIDKRVFDQTLEEYMRHSKRTLAEVITSKALFIARHAVRITQKADPGSIRSSLGGFVRVQQTSKSGRLSFKRKLELVKSRDSSAPLAALLVNKGRSSGLQGRAMADAIKKLINSRIKAIAYMKSGWIPAILTLTPYADRKGQPSIDNAAMKHRNHRRGRAVRGMSAGHFVVRIVNEAFSKWDKRNGFMRIGGIGLRKAFDMEVASMRQYIERKTKPDADRFNSKNR